MSEPRLYFEDVAVGASAESPGQTLTEADVTRYVALTGEWEERFTSVEAARESPEGGRVIPEVLPLCISSGLGWRLPHPPLAVMAFMGFEWKFLHPIRAGDTLRSRSRTVAKRALKEGGIIVEEREILNQRDEVVQTGRVTFLVARRPQG